MGCLSGAWRGVRLEALARPFRPAEAPPRHPGREQASVGHFVSHEDAGDVGLGTGTPWCSPAGESEDTRALGHQRDELSPEAHEVRRRDVLGRACAEEVRIASGSGRATVRPPLRSVPRSFGNGPGGFGNGARGFSNEPGGFGNGPGSFGNGPGSFGNETHRANCPDLRDISARKACAQAVRGAPTRCRGLRAGGRSHFLDVFGCRVRCRSVAVRCRSDRSGE